MADVASPRRNRVAPTGEIQAVPERGAWMGNRGCLHDDTGVVVRDAQVRRWITCRLSFRGRHHPQAAPGRYTSLFFLDEATALAAGHRPCAECRREDYVRFLAGWRATQGPVAGADALDRLLDDARRRPAGAGDRPRRRHVQRTCERPWAGLPDGVFVAGPDGPALVWAGSVRPWSPGGYAAGTARPGSGSAVVLTPAPVVDVIAWGYVPQVDASAGG